MGGPGCENVSPWHLWSPQFNYKLETTNIKSSTRKGFLSSMKTTGHKLYSRAS